MKDFWFKIKNFLYWTLLDDKYSEILRLLNIKKANMVDTIGDHLISGTPNYTFVLSEAMSEFPGRSVRGSVGFWRSAPARRNPGRTKYLSIHCV